MSRNLNFAKLKKDVFSFFPLQRGIKHLIELSLNINVKYDVTTSGISQFEMLSQSKSLSPLTMFTLIYMFVSLGIVLILSYLTYYSVLCVEPCQSWMEIVCNFTEFCLLIVKITIFQYEKCELFTTLARECAVHGDDCICWGIKLKAENFSSHSDVNPE